MAALKAHISKIEKKQNGRYIHIRLPNWISVSLIIFIITGIVNVVIFICNIQSQLTYLQKEVKDNKIIHQAFINAFWDLNLNVYKYIPAETTVRGNTENRDAKHEEILNSVE